MKLLAEDNPSSLINYIEHHELYLNFEDARVAFEKNQVLIVIVDYKLYTRLDS